MAFKTRPLSVLMIATLVSAAPAATQPTPSPSSQFFTASDGLKIHYVTVGDSGTWVVLIHGFADTADRMWFRTGIAAVLARNHRVVALDSRQE